MGAGDPLASSPLSERLLERAAREWDCALTPTQAARLEAYLHLLARWNRTINLTALPLDGFPDVSLARVIGEPLAAARYAPDDGRTWLDLGSGGGTPAIPLKIARDSLVLTMVESRSRKAAFLGEAIRLLQLENTSVIAERFERLSRPAVRPVDLVTIRAVRVDAAVAKTIEGLLRPGGRLLLFTSVSGEKNPRHRGALGEEDSTLRIVSSTPLPSPGSVLEVWERR